MGTKDRVDLKIQMRKAIQRDAVEIHNQIIGQSHQNESLPTRSFKSGYKTQRQNDVRPSRGRQSAHGRNPNHSFESTRSQGKNKVVIGNLNNDVTIQDIKQLMHSVARDIEVTKLHPGTMVISFAHPTDASRAISQFDGRKLDGRKMILNLIS